MLQAMRQDLTVQHVKDSLAVETYEAHARAALEYGNDKVAFLQCLSQLAQLYDAGVPGCVEEFTAYRILYMLLHATETLALKVTLIKLSPEVSAVWLV